MLDAERDIGDEKGVGLDYRTFQDAHRGDTLVLDEGDVLGVSGVRGSRISTVVEPGGVLSNNKGINRKGGGLTAPALTEKDMRDIKTAAELKADFLGVSFPRSGDDIRWARDLMREAGGNSLIVAKIERAEAITALEEILDASDAIMVARGDLAVEVGDAVVPALQKRMIVCRDKNRQCHCHADDGIDDQQSIPSGPSFRCRERRSGRNRSSHAFRRDGDGDFPVRQ